MATSRIAALSRHVQQPPLGLKCQPCTAGATLDQQPPMSVFVLIGQSNMAGRGALTPGDASDPPAADVLCFGYDDDSWQPASQPLHFDPPIVRSLDDPEPKGAGLGWAFARKLLDDGLVDGSVGLVPCAFGGSPLSRWVRQPRTGEQD
eukprot:SAG25_NODE_5049_length_709_cov_2.347541_1_plen_147_part_10